ncbi:MAG: hypothetical protein UX75_C0062G0012 [Candidatus Moranbacteria bacterium GW2011_GWE2_47_10]|nr:MAG: hypothetical protein UX75_C0062G0012 [Candidatus Moranbacteria bacterium GW2011_GWE2_47_10]
MFDRFFGGGAKKPQPGEISPEKKAEIATRYAQEGKVDIEAKVKETMDEAEKGKVNPKGEGRGKVTISEEKAHDATQEIRKNNTGPFFEISPSTENELETQLRGMGEFLDDFGHYEEVLKGMEENLKSATEERHKAILEIETFMEANKVRKGDDERLVELRQRAIGMRNSLQSIGGMEKAA